MGSKLKDDFEPFWDEEKEWLCTVEFLPRDDPEARSFSAQIIGYLFGCFKSSTWQPRLSFTAV
jgi:hypothetical protein